VSVAQSQPQVPFAAPVRVGEALSGAINGINTVFTTAAKFVHLPPGETIRVYFNGQRLLRGGGLDFTVAESGGPGTGYDTLMLGFAPYNLGAPHVDSLTADYVVA